MFLRILGGGIVFILFAVLGTLSVVTLTKTSDGDKRMYVAEKTLKDQEKELKKLQKHRDSVKAWAASGDVKDKTVPKMTIVSAPKAGGILNTRSFIPHRVHDAVGVLAAASVATAAARQCWGQCGCPPSGRQCHHSTGRALQTRGRRQGCQLA